MVAARDQENRSWDQANLELTDSHTAEKKELQEAFDVKVEEEKRLQEQVRVETSELRTQFREEKVLVEEDADNEVDDEKASYESKLVTEKRLTQKLRDENGLSKKKFAQLTKDVEDQKEEMSALRDREFDLRESIKNLEKDVQGHKKEIRERDETIADKVRDSTSVSERFRTSTLGRRRQRDVTPPRRRRRGRPRVYAAVSRHRRSTQEKRIFDLKKKNQELEKFKFVLDYKIKELKRQIEPRESEIADLRRQVEEMDLELEQYHKSNAALDLMIGELRLKLDGMSKELSQQKSLIKAGESYTRKFRRDLAMCAAGVEDQNDLKAGVKELYQRYVLDEDKRKDSEESTAGFDLQAEYARQREHLERNVAQLKRKVLKDETMYKTDKKRMASEGKLLTETMAKLKAVHAEDLQRREDLAVRAEEQASDPRLAEIVAGLGERAQMLEELMGEAGLLHPPPLPQ